MFGDLDDESTSLGRQDATTVRNQRHNYGDIAYKDTKLEDLVVEVARASLITHTHPQNVFLILQ